MRGIGRFCGEELRLIKTCGAFITMPGNQESRAESQRASREK